MPPVIMSAFVFFEQKMNLLSLIIALQLLVNGVLCDYRTVLYTGGLYQNAGEDTPEDTTSIEESGFETIILWTLHITPNANLIYNGELIAYDGKLNESQFGPNGMDIKNKIYNLKTSKSSSVQNVLFCIGSGGKTTHDYANIETIYKNPTLKKTLYDNFQVLLDLGIDGFDFDNEEGMTQTNQNNIADMVANFNKMGAKYLTFCPYTQADEWLDCLKIIYKNNGKQLVNWWNVQCYAGGNNNKARLKSEWIDEIERNESSVGINNASAFIVPGFDASVGTFNVEQEFKQYGAGVVYGGFIWEWPDTTGVPNANKWYNALVNGLDGQISLSNYATYFSIPYSLL